MRFMDNWQAVVHQRNVDKGFYDYEKDIAIVERIRCIADRDEREALDRVLVDYKRAMTERKLLLIIGELCEAHEELRSGHAPHEIYHNGDNPKPEGFGIEMADAAIRQLDLMEHLGLKQDMLMEAKHDYNGTRPYKHGKQF